MEQLLVDHIVLRNEFGIESIVSPKEMIEREKDTDLLYLKQNMNRRGFTQKLKNCLEVLMSQRNFYNLKVERVKNVNLYLAGKLNESGIGKEEFRRIVELALLEKYWWFNDFFNVMIELIIDCLLSIPFVSIFLFQEIEHSSYSLRSEHFNIYGFNLKSNDIWLAPSKVIDRDCRL